MAETANAELFAAERSLLLGVAYRILGRVTDAEDVVQEAWIRWSEVDPSTVNDPRAFLVRVASRLRVLGTTARKPPFSGCRRPSGACARR
jgi:RNA polymerase sigma-70 factor, ECF subfamily